MLEPGADEQMETSEPQQISEPQQEVSSEQNDFFKASSLRARRREFFEEKRNPFDIRENRLGENIMDADGFGLRAAFRIPVLILIVITYIVISSISYFNVTDDELAKAEHSIRSEVNYLCLQLQSLEERSDAFGRIASVSGKTPEELADSDPEDFFLLSDPVGDILVGYTLEETGTVLIVAGDVVIASDDERLPVGSSVKDSIGDVAYGAVATSIESEELQQISLTGAFGQAGSGDGNTDGYLLARQQGEYTVVIFEPSSMVFKNRGAIMGRQAILSLVILLVVSLILDRLLVYLVARRIDKTNQTLERITKGDLGARVEEVGTREFKSLARGINATVDTLEGWIGEAENRMNAELATAKAIQEAALPRTFPPFPGIAQFDIYASMDAAREVGGDFYDFFLVGDDSSPDKGKLAFVAADVSGKGVPAALFMMRAKAFIRDCLQSEPDLGVAVAEANCRIREGNDSGMFVTAWIGVLDYATGHLDYVNAGHNPPLLWKRDEGWQWLRQKSGLVLGLFDVSYNSYSLECESGDELLLYTDGVTEAYGADGTLYGEARLYALVEDGGVLPPQELQRIVRDDVAVHAEGVEQSDDITILVLAIN